MSGSRNRRTAFTGGVPVMRGRLTYGWPWLGKGQCSRTAVRLHSRVLLDTVAALTTLLLLSNAAASPNNTYPILPLGNLTVGTVALQSPTTTPRVLLNLPVSECLAEGSIFVELLSDSLPITELGLGSLKTLILTPQSTGSGDNTTTTANVTTYSNSTSNSNTTHNINSTSTSNSTISNGSNSSAINSSLGYVPTPRAESPVPLLLINTNGVPPEVQVVRKFEYGYNDNTSAVDFPDYFAQQPVQYGTFEIPGNYSGPDWILEVFGDFAVLGGSSTQFFLRASCSGCPANCGGPTRGSCGVTGLCTCLPMWGGASCTTRMENLAAANGSAQIISALQWAYYYFTIPSQSTLVLLEVLCTQGNIVIFMKPEDQGLLKHGIPTSYDFPKYSDESGYRNSLAYQYILWDHPQPGSAYIGVLNMNEDNTDSNFTMQLRISQGAEPICPRDCSYPNGKCVLDNGTTFCQCTQGFAGDFCEAQIFDVTLAQVFSYTLMPLQMVYLKFDVPFTGNFSLQMVYQGGHLFVVVAFNGTVPTLSNSVSTELSMVPMTGAILPLQNDNPWSTVIIGIYNSNQLVFQNSTIQARFYTSYDDPVPFVNSPFMVVIFSLVGVLFVAVIAIVLRRIVGGGMPPLNDNYMLPNLNIGTVGRLNPPQGLPKEVVSAFPLVRFREEDCEALHESQCAVCLAEYEEDELVRKLPECHHMFHVSCVDQWLSTHNTCPMCRCSLASFAPPNNTPTNETTSEAEEANGVPLETGLERSPSQVPLMETQGTSVQRSSEHREDTSINGVPREHSEDAPVIVHNPKTHYPNGVHNHPSQQAPLSTEGAPLGSHLGDKPSDSDPIETPIPHVGVMPHRGEHTLNSSSTNEERSVEMQPGRLHQHVS